MAGNKRPGAPKGPYKQQDTIKLEPDVWDEIDAIKIAKGLRARNAAIKTIVEEYKAGLMSADAGDGRLNRKVTETVLAIINWYALGEAHM